MTESCVLVVGGISERTDRLIAISGSRDQELQAECSLDEGVSWRPATVYVGDSADAWYAGDVESWNRSVIEGWLPAGEIPCVWNPFFDVPLACRRALLRVSTAAGKHEGTYQVDLDAPGTGLVVAAERFADLAGGALPAPWRLRAGAEGTSTASLWCPGEGEVPALELDLGLSGWYRIYLGMEPFAAVDFSLSGADLHLPIPDHQRNPEGDQPLRREYLVCCAELTGGTARLAPGNTRFRRDVSVHHLRFVPMSAREIAAHRALRRLAETRGRVFTAYMEQVTPSAYDPALTLRGHTHDDMRLNRYRGATEVYAHVIRAGSKAWYHSRVVERFDGAGAAPSWHHFATWMASADPLAVALEEAGTNGLALFADMGMNITYQTDAAEYQGLTERTIRENPGMVCADQPQFMDYRQERVRAYVAAIARELMTQYDVAGIHLDFARFAYNRAFDEASLVDVVRRINSARVEAAAQWGHPVKIAIRIPSYLYMTRPGWEYYEGEYAEFTAALGEWARRGWIDRVMVCAMDPPDLIRLSLTRYKRAIEGTPVQLWGDLYATVPTLPPSYYLEVGRRWLAEGLDGGFFFYSRIVPTDFFGVGWELRVLGLNEREASTD